jgi:ATP-dependent DNA ligase
VAKPPTGKLWIHEIMHDGYRLMVRRDRARVRCFAKRGHNWPTVSPPSPRPRASAQGDIVPD